ncbi:MAG: DUF167 domain-containing protein [Panacagrimonas sp.]
MKVLSVQVKPRSRSSVLERQDDGSWLARLKAPPVDGKANAELIALIAKTFDCRKSDVRITSGATSRFKRIEVVD